MPVYLVLITNYPKSQRLQCMLISVVLWVNYAYWVILPGVSLVRMVKTAAEAAMGQKHGARLDVLYYSHS